ncbi:hypothetical protein K438DRAFT_2100525 [Mycena galopus ATCC 62051]|nr:hypothetical protein K438DRAFT_2100525 [Mycena galopus ATCC 62051]
MIYPGGESLQCSGLAQLKKESLVGLENSTQTCVKKSGTKSEKPEVVLPRLQWKECPHRMPAKLDIAAAHCTGTSKDVRVSRRRWPSAGVASSAGGRGVRISLERIVEESEMSAASSFEEKERRARRCAYPGKGTRSLEQSGAFGAEDMVAPRGKRVGRITWWMPSSEKRPSVKTEERMRVSTERSGMYEWKGCGPMYAHWRCTSRCLGRTETAKARLRRVRPLASPPRCSIPARGSTSYPPAAPLPPLDLSTAAAEKVKHTHLSRAHTPSHGGPRVARRGQEALEAKGGEIRITSVKGRERDGNGIESGKEWTGGRNEGGHRVDPLGGGVCVPYDHHRTRIAGAPPRRRLSAGGGAPAYGAGVGAVAARALRPFPCGEDRGGRSGRGPRVARCRVALWGLLHPGVRQGMIGGQESGKMQGHRWKERKRSKHMYSAFFERRNAKTVTLTTSESPSPRRIATGHGVVLRTKSASAGTDYCRGWSRDGVSRLKAIEANIRTLASLTQAIPSPCRQCSEVTSVLKV